MKRLKLIFICIFFKPSISFSHMKFEGSIPALYLTPHSNSGALRRLSPGWMSSGHPPQNVLWMVQSRCKEGDHPDSCCVYMDGIDSDDDALACGNVRSGWRHHWGFECEWELVAAGETLRFQETTRFEPFGRSSTWCGPSIIYGSRGLDLMCRKSQPVSSGVVVHRWTTSMVTGSVTNIVNVLTDSHASC